MNAAHTIRFAGLAFLGTLLLASCAGRTRETQAPSNAVAGHAATHEGRPYQIEPARSLLTIRVYRAGTLARMGHNHVVASHDLQGTVYVPADLTRSSFQVRIPVAKLSVDESELRTQAGPDFPPEVPDSAKEGTRRNMLSEALLDAEQFPEILLTSERVDVSTPTDLLTQIQVTVRNQTHTLAVPVHYELGADALSASGEFSLKHSDLGLTPFSAMLGAIQVQDEMKVRFKVYFAASSPSNASAP
jgi:polyisoprenoid-binding protein YceI